MKPKEYKKVLDAVEKDGLDYTFIHYSHFPEIEDVEFRDLVNRYIDSRQQLANFIGFED